MDLFGLLATEFTRLTWDLERSWESGSVSSPSSSLSLSESASSVLALRMADNRVLGVCAVCTVCAVCAVSRVCLILLLNFSKSLSRTSSDSSEECHEERFGLGGGFLRVLNGGVTDAPAGCFSSSELDRLLKSLTEMDADGDDCDGHGGIGVGGLMESLRSSTLPLYAGAGSFSFLNSFLNPSLIFIVVHKESCVQNN